MTALSARLALVLRSLDDSSLMYTCGAARPVLSGHSEYSPLGNTVGTYACGGTPSNNPLDYSQEASPASQVVPVVLLSPTYREQLREDVLHRERLGMVG